MNNYLPEDPEKELFDAILNLEQERKESMKIDFGQAF